MSFGLKLCEECVLLFCRHRKISERTALKRGVEGRAGWRGWTKLTMARPPDDGGAEAYIDEAATII